MNKYMCASIINLHKIKSCTRTAARCSNLSSGWVPSSWSLVCTNMHIDVRHRWWLLLCCVVMQYDFKEHLIKFFSGCQCVVYV